MKMKSMRKEIIMLLKKLSEVNGIAGHEAKVRQIVEEELLTVVSKDDLKYDNIGSVIAKKGSKGPKIMLAGHMDEVGMIVTKITDQGFIKFQPIGGWWNQVMLAHEVTVTTADGHEVHGVIGSKPPHILTAEERKKPVEISDMYIDLGVKSKEEVLNLGVKIGDMITPYTEFRVMANEDILLGKAWDNRIGCAVMLEVMKRLKDIEHPNIVYGVATVQEEVGTRGAKTSSNVVKPDISIAVDVGIANDTPGSSDGSKMGEGPQLLLIDGGLVGHVGLRELFIKVAEENHIPYQLDYLKGGGDRKSVV